jgi:hypothetical protein
MLKGFTVLATAAAVLVVLPVHAETAIHKKHAVKYSKTHIVRVAGQAAPAHYGLDKFPAGPLYYNGDVYMGDDPDPFIRSQLWRDVSGRFGGGDN